MMTNCLALMGNMGWLMSLAALSLLGLGMAALLKYQLTSTKPTMGASS